MRKFEVAVLLAATMLCGAPCLAATPVSAAKTKEFHEAYAAFNANEPTRAYKILTALVDQTQAYDAIGLLGQTELSLGKYRDAAEHLSIAISNTPSSKADALPVLKDDLIEAKTQITTLQIAVDQPDADVSVDGKVVGKSPLNTEVFVDPGKHTVRATHPTQGNAETSIDTKMGEASAITLKLATLPPPNTADASTPPALKYTPADLDKPSNTTTSPPPPVEKRGIEGRTIVLLAGGAVTLIAAGTGTYFAVKSRSARKDTEALVAQGHEEFGLNACVQSDGASAALCNRIAKKNDDRLDAARGANISFAITGVAVLATGLTYLLWPRAKTPTSAFVVVPVVSPNASGLSIQGDF